MGADPAYPELTTNEEWRVLMVAARKDRKLKQIELATMIERHSKLTATQALISQIEGGQITSSKLVRPICEVLSIPEPMHFQDEEMKAWWLAGHLMRAKSMALFRSQLAGVQTMLKELRAAANEDEPVAPTPQPEPRSRK